jgi:stage V sporulation protein G
MELTEIRIKLIRDKADKLRAFASITIDQTLVIRDLKLIEGGNGLFVAMPSRKLCDRCPACAGKNQLRSRFCNDCGQRLREQRGRMDDRGRPRLYADIAHPINQDARDMVQGRVIEAYLAEVARSKEAGYVATTFDDLDYDSYDQTEV